MKTFVAACIKVIWFTTTCLLVGATPSQTGSTITGRVRDGETGRYLSNARVTVAGTSLITFTDDAGLYLINNVTGENPVVEVFYTGLPVERSPVPIASNKLVVHDVTFRDPATGTEGKVVKLGAYTVTSARETDREALAINEQRFSGNMKLVVSADALGEVIDGNVAEVMKFLPGITATSDRGEDPSAISRIQLRGLASNLTTVAMDGADISNTASSGGSGTSRDFFFSQASVNNVSRIEVVKVPTAAHPANSMGGAINMVSKSAFERDKAQFDYSITMSGNSMNASFSKIPFPDDTMIVPVTPSYSFDFSYPASKNFGVVVTASSSNRYSRRALAQKTYNIGGSSTGATSTRPFLQTLRMQDGFGIVERDSLGIKADWRVSRFSVLSFGVQGSHYEFEQTRLESMSNVGTIGTPTVASGVPMTFDEANVTGATGRGSVNVSPFTSNPVRNAASENIGYRFDNGDMRILASVSHSMSKGGYRGSAPDFIQLTAAPRQTPVRVIFAGINDVVPSVVRAFSNANEEIDLLSAATYDLQNISHTTRHNRDSVEVASAEIKKAIPYFSFPFYIQTGGSRRIQRRDIRIWRGVWNYTPPGGDRSIAPFVAPLYVGRENYTYGLKNRPMMSPYITWRAFTGPSSPFTQTAAQYVAQERQKLTDSQTLREDVTAYFAQIETRLFKNRLHALGGVRYEQADNEGLGPLSDPGGAFQRAANGDFLRGSNGARLRRPEAGAVGSLEEMRLTVKERASKVASNYDGFFPSVHLNYSLTESALFRVGYAKTYARPPFLTTSTTISENENAGESGASPGRINIVNSSLRPWTAQNIDLSLEYYSKSGGIFTFGVFRKNISDFFSSTTIVLGPSDIERFGLEPSYLGWDATTLFNFGSARVEGMEFNVRSTLERLGKLGRYVTVFANGTKLRLVGNPSADFSGFVPETANWGITVRRAPVMLTARWNYRGEQRGNAAPAMGPGAYLYDDDRLTCDVAFEYQVSRRFTLFGNVQNIYDAPNISLSRGPETPGYASRNWTVNSGSTITLGLKGRF